jgi:hypothetical protein
MLPEIQAGEQVTSVPPPIDFSPVEILGVRRELRIRGGKPTQPLLEPLHNSRLRIRIRRVFHKEAQRHQIPQGGRRILI